MNKDKILIYSNHHRRSPWFERTIQRLWDDGFKNIVIQNTGGNGDFHQYQGPAKQIIHAGHQTYDSGMRGFKRTLNVKDIDAMVLIDNDCFLSGTAHFNKYVEEFLEQGYDFASHYVSASAYVDAQHETYKAGRCIADSVEQKFLQAEVFPGFVPEPHWENAYLIIRPEMWNRLTDDDVSHGRKYLKALTREGAKMGTHEAKYVGTHSHYGEEWFHVGALMQFYYYVESGAVDKFNEASTFDMARLGYFLDTETKFPGSLPDRYKANIAKIMNKLTNKDAPISAWKGLTSGTCIETWS